MNAHPILFAGGTGVVGLEAVKLFRARHPDLPLLIGGRDIAKANAAARAVGNAQGVAIDMMKPKLALNRDEPLAAIVVATPDDGLNALRFAQDRGIPYVSISNWLVEIGGEVAYHICRPDASPIVLASHWQGGTMVFLALATVAGMDLVRSVHASAVGDVEDPIGPAAIEDMARAGEGGSAGALAFCEGARVWLTGDLAKRAITAIDGRALEASAIAPYDIVSLQAATGAREVRFDLASDMSSSRARGGPVAAELIVEVEGEIDGQPVRRRSTIDFPQGQAVLTGFHLVLALSTTLGLEGRPAAAPGLYFPETLMATDWVLHQLARQGAAIHIDHARPAPNGEPK